VQEDRGKELARVVIDFIRRTSRRSQPIDLTRRKRR
jgi:hypothetical protein